MKRITTKAVIETVPQLTGKLSGQFFERLTSLLNRSKGSTYEKMAAAVVIANAVEQLEISDPLILIDKKEFSCFDDASQKRRWDIFLENHSIAYEVKSYRPCYSSFIREQIRKDAWLLENKKAEQIWWLLFQGATTSVLNALTRYGIIYIDVLNTNEDFTNIPQLGTAAAITDQIQTRLS